MIGFGLLAVLVALVGLWFTRRRPGDGRGGWFFRAAIVGRCCSVRSAQRFGWIFTEMGRQPWVVYGVLRTADGVSPSVTAGTVSTSLIVLHPALRRCSPSSRSDSCSRTARRGPATRRRVGQGAADGENGTEPHLGFAY